MILGAVVALVLARFSPLHYVLLSGRHILFIATMITIVMASAGMSTWLVVGLGAVLPAVVGAAVLGVAGASVLGAPSQLMAWNRDHFSRTALTGRCSTQSSGNRACRVLTDGGSDVSPEHIARVAGVGVGTVYRRFPTVDALVQAVLEE